MADEVVLGVISDTHGKLPPQAEYHLRGVDRILHAGDLDDPQVLAELELIAPVTAVRGNNDFGQLAKLPLVASFEAAGVAFRMSHMLRDATREPLAGVRVIVYGHTHVPRAEELDGILYLNPGSPSWARRGSGHHLALLRIVDGVPTAESVTL